MTNKELIADGRKLVNLSAPVRDRFALMADRLEAAEKRIAELEGFLQLASDVGGIVSTAAMSQVDISLAQAGDRMIVTSAGLGFVAERRAAARGPLNQTIDMQKERIAALEQQLTNVMADNKCPRLVDATRIAALESDLAAAAEKQAKAEGERDQAFARVKAAEERTSIAEKARDHAIGRVKSEIAIADAILGRAKAAEKDRDEAIVAQGLAERREQVMADGWRHADDWREMFAAKCPDPASECVVTMLEGRTIEGWRARCLDEAEQRVKAEANAFRWMTEARELGQVVGRAQASVPRVVTDKHREVAGIIRKLVMFLWGYPQPVPDGCANLMNLQWAADLLDGGEGAATK